MDKVHERKLTPAEVKDREDIIMKMKDNKRSLVKKYGKDAEAVMYGRATNMVKNKTESMKAKPNRLTELIKDSLKNPKKADLNKDGKLSDYEKTRGAAIEKNLKEKVVKGKDGDKYKKHDVSNLEEDLDIGHEDNEPHMLKADLYRIGKYAMELYGMIDKFDGMGEVDFPSWWQAKVFKAKDALVGAKHYLDFEIKEPQIDAVVDIATDAIDENEKITENMNMDKWRRAYNGKAFASKVVLAQDGMGNKKRYVIFFRYNETPRADVVSLRERHMGGHEGSAMPFSMSNMQNKPEYLFTSDDKMEFGSDEEFDNFTKEGSKGLEDMLSFFLGGKNVDDAIRKWFDTGVQRIVDIKPAKYFDAAKVNENTTKDRISKILEGLPKGFWDKKIDAEDENQDGKKDVKEDAYARADKHMQGRDAESSRDPFDSGELADGDYEEDIEESYDSLVKKIRKQGKSKKAASAIAGAVASYKSKGGGKGPTAKQK